MKCQISNRIQTEEFEVEIYSRIITASFVTLLVLAFLTVLPTSKVYAEVSIIQLSPSAGPVGVAPSIEGIINTENGSYRVYYDDIEVASGNATGYVVSTDFIIENGTYGSHLVTLQDAATGENSTAQFMVQTEYTIKALLPSHPEQLQEGTNVTILSVVTGGNATTSANITVTDPSNGTYMAQTSIPINQGNISGFGSVSSVYPTDFGSSAHTFYVGTYNLSLNPLNGTSATSSFTVGITDASEYHRFQTVNLRAANYTSEDVLKIVVTHDDQTVFESSPANASDPGGIIAANWTIPSNASLGLYKSAVVNTSSPLTIEKPVPDRQDFLIVSKTFAVEVTTINWEDEPVEGIQVEAHNTTSKVETEVTDADGNSLFTLETSDYTFKAFLNNSQVGATSKISVAENLTGIQALSIKCSLVHIWAAVRDEEGRELPFITISANFTYTAQNKTFQREVSTDTDLNGIATLRNLFLNINYTVKASRYDQIFDTTSKNLTETSWFNSTCPTLDLAIEALDREGLPLEDVTVKVYDAGIGLGGLVGEKIGEFGEVNFNLTFGKYIVEVYDDDFLLNRTTVLLVNQPTDLQVHCSLSNLTLDVIVLDYFGQGIANANVTIEREGITISSSTTDDGGDVRFVNLLGGKYRALVFIGGTPHQISTFNLQEPQTSLTLKIAEIASIGGIIIEISHLTTLVFVFFSIIVLVTFSYYMLRLKGKAK